MNFLYAIFGGAGVAGFVYSKVGRRVGYGNNQNVAAVVGVSFIIATIVFYSLIVLFFK